jgi:hypothetical protein
MGDSNNSNEIKFKSNCGLQTAGICVHDETEAISRRLECVGCFNNWCQTVENEVKHFKSEGSTGNQLSAKAVKKCAKSVALAESVECGHF